MLHGSVGRCRHCGLVQIVPMPSRGEISRLYYKDIEHFEPYVEQADVHRKYFQKKVNEIVAEVAPIKPRILDIGCAMGILLEEANKKGIDAYGVDVSDDAVAYCRKKGLKVTRTYPNKKFSAVTAFEVIEHEHDPLGMVTRIHKLLNNGGIAVLTTPNHSGFWQKLMGKSWVSYRHPEHVTFWDPVSLRFLMKKAGFKKVEIAPDTPRPFPLSFLFTRAADYFPWAGWILRPIGKLLDKFKLINPINPWDDLIVIGRT